VISSDFESEYMCLSHKATSIFESQYSLHSQSHSIAHVTSIFSPVIYGFHHYAQYFVFQNHPIVFYTSIHNMLVDSPRNCDSSFSCNIYSSLLFSASSSPNEAFSTSRCELCLSTIYTFFYSSSTVLCRRTSWAK
jgi:hypothetical protein